MAYTRRRHQFPHRLIPVISVILAAILLFFVFLSFLAPSLVETDHIRRAKINNDVGEENEAVKFHIANNGGVHHRDFWSTKKARFYYGCSNATSQFAEAAAVTHPDRYLAIATSGGLNQQRTGVVGIASWEVTDQLAQFSVGFAVPPLSIRAVLDYAKTKQAEDPVVMDDWIHSSMLPGG